MKEEALITRTDPHDQNLFPKTLLSFLWRFFFSSVLISLPKFFESTNPTLLFFFSTQTKKAEGEENPFGTANLAFTSVYVMVSPMHPSFSGENAEGGKKRVSDKATKTFILLWAVSGMGARERHRALYPTSPGFNAFFSKSQLSVAPFMSSSLARMAHLRSPYPALLEAPFLGQPLLPQSRRNIGSSYLFPHNPLRVSSLRILINCGSSFLPSREIRLKSTFSCVGRDHRISRLSMSMF